MAQKKCIPGNTFSSYRRGLEGGFAPYLRHVRNGKGKGGERGERMRHEGQIFHMCLASVLQRFEAGV